MLEGLVFIYRHNNLSEAEKQYNQFFDELFKSSSNYAALRTLYKMHKIGVNYLRNGRANDENLLRTLETFDRLLLKKIPELGKKLSKKLSPVYLENWNA